MTTHVFPGLRTTPLITYLAALGLGRVVAEQVDARARFGWRNGVFHLDADIDDVAEFLIHRYAPTPVLSPWNAEAGFGTDPSKRAARLLARIEETSSQRFAPYRSAISVVRRCEAEGTTMFDHSLTKKNGKSSVDERKKRLVKKRAALVLRGRLPDPALLWMDACIALGSDALLFSALLGGSGGVDGRMEMGRATHESLAKLFPELGGARDGGIGWLNDLLFQRSTVPLASSSSGLFDPVATGGTASPRGAIGDDKDKWPLMNPWAFVLMTEGVVLWTSSIHKRYQGAAGFLATPFTVQYASPEVHMGSAAEEKNGVECWAPIVQGVTLPELRQIFGEGRAAWDGQAATSVAAMYAAVHSFGVQRGIEQFQRFGLVARNGNSWFAVPLDTVRVESRPEVVMARQPLRRAETFKRGQGSATAVAARRFDGAAVGFVRDPQWRSGVAMLRAQTELELTVMRSQGNREALGRTAKLVPASVVVPVMQDLLTHSAEARVAAGIASARFLIAGMRGSQPIRQLLIGLDPSGPHQDSKAPAPVAGFTSRSTVDVLADLMVWLAQHPGEDERQTRGWLPWVWHNRQVPWQDIHAWVGGYLDEDKLTEYLTAFLAVNWKEQNTATKSAQLHPPVRSVDPTLALLQTLASGRLKLGDGADAEIHGLRPEWAIQLRADRVSDVHTAASGVVNRTKLHCGDDEWPLHLSTSPHRLATSGLGKRILAALAAPSTTRALRFSAPELTDNTLNEGEAS